jgi:hypothetical protein
VLLGVGEPLALILLTRIPPDEEVYARLGAEGAVLERIVGAIEAQQ